MTFWGRIFRQLWAFSALSAIHTLLKSFALKNELSHTLKRVCFTAVVYTSQTGQQFSDLHDEDHYTPLYCSNFKVFLQQLLSLSPILHPDFFFHSLPQSPLIARFASLTLRPHSFRTSAFPQTCGSNRTYASHLNIHSRDPCCLVPSPLSGQIHCTGSFPDCSPSTDHPHLLPCYSFLQCSVFLQCPVISVPGTDCNLLLCVSLFDYLFNIIILPQISSTVRSKLCLFSPCCIPQRLLQGFIHGWSLQIVVECMHGWMHACMHAWFTLVDFREEVWWHVCLKCMGLITSFLSQLCDLEQAG